MKINLIFFGGAKSILNFIGTMYRVIELFALAQNYRFETYCTFSKAYLLLFF